MIEYIETNNKRFPVRFGFNALREFSRVTGMPLAALTSLQNDYAGLVRIHRRRTKRQNAIQDGD